MKFTKNWYQSKTIVAVVWLLLLLAKDYAGIEISESEVFAIFEEATKVILAVVAIYGRIVAETEINK